MVTVTPFPKHLVHNPQRIAALQKLAESRMEEQSIYYVIFEAGCEHCGYRISNKRFCLFTQKECMTRAKSQTKALIEAVNKFIQYEEVR